MRTDFERVYLEASGPVAVLTLNHPEALNALSFKMAGGFCAALDAVERAGGRYRALLITGEGRAFCSGAHLGEAPEHRGKLLGPAEALDTIFHPLLRRLRDLPIPIVVAVNGAAAGIGMSIALMGDIVMAARSAYFLQAFVRIGLVPDGGSTWLLPRLIGLARAKELSMLTDKLPAETAFAWGLINRVCEDQSLIAEALETARRLAKGPTATLAAIRKLYWDSPQRSYDQQLDAEQHAQDQASQTEDFKEGLSAFRLKRPPQFKGR